MRIRMLTNAYGPTLRADADCVVDVASAQAKEFIEGGYAVQVPPSTPLGRARNRRTPAHAEAA